MQPCRSCGKRPRVAKGLCSPCYKRARRSTLPAPSAPRVGDPSGYGTYGELDRDYDTALCHECGGRYEALGSHVYRAHEMTADEYRQAHGLPRTLSLQSLELQARLSRLGRERVGTPAWRRLEAARDPVAASMSRDDDAKRGGPGVYPARAERGPRHLPQRSRRVRTCPACGDEHTRRGDCCGKPACVSALRAQAARAEMAARYRPLTEAEVVEVRAATGEGLRELVERLRGERVSSAEIGRALGRSGAWMSEHFPIAPR